MMIKELVEKSRSYRRFYGEKKITEETLTDLIKLTIFCPSTGNIQPMKYMIVCDEETNKKVYETLAWAGYLKEWNGPSEEERPTGYVIMLRDKSLMKALNFDDGILAQTICLGAAEIGLGTCMIASVKRNELKEALNINNDFDISMVIALGYPNENIIIDQIGEDASFKYWRDDESNHHVPKRTIEELIVK